MTRLQSRAAILRFDRARVRVLLAREPQRQDLRGLESAFTARLAGLQALAIQGGF